MQCIGPSYVEFLKTTPAAIHSDAAGGCLRVQK